MKRSKLYLAIMAASLGPGLALADGTAERDVGTIGVQGNTTLGGGYLAPEQSAKSRSTITREAMDKQTATANAIDRLQYLPGLHVTSNDASGISGFNFTMRGLAANQIGMSLDGMPINDSGNYALYANLLGDPENLDQIFVTQGSSELDGPHIGSSGGNIGLTTVRPTKDSDVFVKQAVGNNGLTKTFARLNTGEINGFSNWLSASHTEGDLWRGKGAVRGDRVEFNSLFDQGNGNTGNLILKYYRQDNDGYVKLTKAQFQQYGRSYTPAPSTPVLGRNGKIASFYELGKNPFENFSAIFNGHLQLRDNLALTFNPYFYWGDGSGSSYFTRALNRDSSRTSVYDLSNLNTAAGYAADGTPNSGVYYRPSRTQTWRPGMTTKLNWDVNDAHSLQFGYWVEIARQAQTQPYIPIKADGKPNDFWPDAHSVVDANGNRVQGRNRHTETLAQKVWVQDTWTLAPDWTLNVGTAYQKVERKADNHGDLNTLPYQRSRTYDGFLPSAGLSYQLDAQNQLFYNINRNMRVPANYVLYDASPDSIDLRPETSWNQELGWRQQRETMAFSASLFFLKFKDRQVSSKDIFGDSVNFNGGDVDNSGLELAWSGLLPHHFNYYTSYTYTRAIQQDNLPVYNRGQRLELPTKGKQFANVPRHMLAANLGWDNGRYYGSFGGKYSSKLYGDLTNDESVSGAAVFNLGAGLYLPTDKRFLKDATLRLNVDNLLDKKYLDGVDGVQTNAAAYQGYAGSSPIYNIAEERTVTVSLEGHF
jgi:iron complex outermembrane receptor protein